MYRKRNLVAGGGLAYDPHAMFAEGDSQIGYLAAAWAASQATVNMSGAFVGSPGSTHVPARVGEVVGGEVAVKVTEVTATPLRFSEARNGHFVDGNVHWLEIENVSDDPVPLKDYEISVVTGVSRNDLSGAEHKDFAKLLARTKELAVLNTHQTGHEHDKAIVGHDDYNADGDNDVKRFPDWMLPAKAFLLIVNRDPEDTILASGKDIEILANPNIDDKTTNTGASFYYFVTPDLNRAFGGRSVPYVGITPARRHVGAPLLVLRSAVDKNETDEAIVDVAGSGRFDDQLDRYKYNFNTEIWPLKGTHNVDRGGPNLAIDGGVWDLTEGSAAEWWKSKGVSSHGVGYDRGVDLRKALGTPGYANDATKDKLTDSKGTSDTTDDEVLLNGNISFSEIMFDASVHAGNERWNLVQWIELYNSSMTEAINLNGWELEIRNSDDHVDSFVDSSFIFGDAIIHPNQTLLLVSARAAKDGINDNRVYNLYTKHARELGLANRRANLLSPAGFFLRLSYKANDGSNTKIVVDEAGNVSVAGRQRSTAEWEAIPPSEGSVRYSLIRQYGTRAEDGNGPDAPAVGTLEDGWIVADLDGGGATFYGHRDDIATPGFRQGGPLPVSLSSFNPKRTDAGSVIITWITASELNNAGFNILRSQQRKGEFKVINVKGIIAGAGTTSERNVYTFTDTTAKPNVIYYYQIEDVSFNGQRQTLTTRRLRGHVSAGGKLTTTWSDLKRVK